MDSNTSQFMQQQTNNKTLSQFASAALIMGVISFFMFSTVFVPFTLGSLAIIFAILSKGSAKKMKNPALIGFAMSVAGIVCAFIIGAVEIFAYYNIDSYHQQINGLYREMYGISLDEHIDQLIGNPAAPFNIPETTDSSEN